MQHIIKLDDLEFQITKMDARSALKLAGTILKLLNDNNLIRGLVMQQFIHNILSTGVQIDGVNEEELRALAQMDSANMVSNLLSSIFSNVSDDLIDELIDKTLCTVSEIKGKVTVPILDIQQEHDFVTIVFIMKEVIMLNFGGAIERIKKLLSHEDVEKA